MATHKRNVSSHHHRQKVQNVKRKLTQTWQSSSRMPPCLRPASDAQLFHPATSISLGIFLFFFISTSLQIWQCLYDWKRCDYFFVFFFSVFSQTEEAIICVERKNFNYTSIWLRIQSTAKIDRLVWGKKNVEKLRLKEDGT